MGSSRKRKKAERGERERKERKEIKIKRKEKHDKKGYSEGEELESRARVNWDIIKGRGIA